MEGTGDVRFPVTARHSEAQQFITQGLGQLYGFWYLEAERSFRTAALHDPECAMAYWGMALTNLEAGREKRAREFIVEAVRYKEAVTPREKMYIEALDAYLKEEKGKETVRRAAYVKALQKLLYKFPDDIEAKALLGLQLWKNDGKGIPLGSHLAVDALFKQVLAENPLHPCHHFVIHLWDKEQPELALESRRSAAGPLRPSPTCGTCRGTRTPG